MTTSSTVKQRTISAGRLYFQPTGETGFRYLGLTPEFSVNIKSDSIDSYSAESGVWELDDQTVTKTTRSGKLTCRQDSLENLALFIIGGMETVTQTSGSVTGEAQSVKPDRHYQLGTSSNNLTGARGISALSFSVTATTWAATTAKVAGNLVQPVTTPLYAYRCTTAGTTGSSEPTWPTTVGATVTDGTVTWTNVGILAPALTTDYTADLDLGTFNVLPTARVHPTLGLTWTAAYTRAANSRDRVTTAELTTVGGTLWHVANNPKGNNRDLYAINVNLTPNGDWQLKTDSPSYVEYAWDVAFLTGPNGEAALLIDGRPE